MQNKDFFSGVPIEVREFLLRLLKKALPRHGNIPAMSMNYTM